MRIGHEAIEAAAAIGLTGLEVPTAWGGLGLGFSVKAQVAEVLGAADFGFTMSLINTHNVAAKLAREAPPELAQRYVPDLLAGRRLGCTALTEPTAGSDFGAIRTLATRTPQGWRIDGEKAWITNAVAADVIVLYAQTEAGSGGRGIACFLVDGRREGFRRQPAFALSGQHAIGAGAFSLDGYIARDDEMLQPPGRAFKSALGSINGARCYIAAMCNGMVGEALRTALAYGRERHSFGRPLAEHQGWRWRLAEASAELAAARLLVAQAAAQVEVRCRRATAIGPGQAGQHAAGGTPVAGSGAGHGRRRTAARALLRPAPGRRARGVLRRRLQRDAAGTHRGLATRRRALTPPGKPRGMKQGFRT